MIVKLLTEHHLDFSKLKRGLQMLVRVYTCQNATLLEISCTGSYTFYYTYNNGAYTRKSTVAPFFARLQRLTIHPRSYDRRKQAKQRRKPFRAKETQPLRSLFCQFLGGRFTQVFTVLIIFGLSSFTLMVEVRLNRDTRLSLIIY